MPAGIQHLLGRAGWDADRVHDDMLEHLGDQDAVLVVGKTGDVKKGTHTVGVQRQYTGTAGRIENAQVAGYLVCAGRRGHAAVDRELYIPAARMIGRFLDAGYRVGWFAGEEVYGGNPKLRAALEERGVGFVLAVACSAEVTTGAGKFRADALAGKVPKRAWQKLSAGAGAKGHRYYGRAVVGSAEGRPGRHRLLIRRNRPTGELAYYRCWSPAPVPPATLIRVAEVSQGIGAGKKSEGASGTWSPTRSVWRWLSLSPPWMRSTDPPRLARRGATSPPTQTSRGAPAPRCQTWSRTPRARSSTRHSRVASQVVMAAVAVSPALSVIRRSPPIRWTVIAPACRSTKPMATAGASEGAMPVSGGRIRPAAPSISTVPSALRAGKGMWSTQAIIGRS
ncbi:transposase [Streptomyces hygroscopicus subsp. limoneus]|nr:transposase [Streptomyces hygroscopicus subsp. limoneus]